MTAAASPPLFFTHHVFHPLIHSRSQAALFDGSLCCVVWWWCEAAATTHIHIYISIYIPNSHLHSQFTLPFTFTLGSNLKLFAYCLVLFACCSLVVWFCSLIVWFCSLAVRLLFGSCLVSIWFLFGFCYPNH